jgi:1,2-diacylglycerol 3-alpha-glucosyltransferase
VRIGFFTDTYTPQINGVVTSIQLFARALERQGHSVYIFAPSPRQATDGPHIIRIPSLPFAFQPEMRMAAIYSAQAHRLARRANLDIIHAHDPFAIGLFGYAVAKRYRLPYVYTHHAVYEEYVHYVWDATLTRDLAERLTRDFCNQCDTVIAPSTKVRRTLEDGGVRKPVVTLPTGVDFITLSQRDPEAVEALRGRFHVPDTARLLTFVGRLGLEKNVDLLIDAMSFVRHPDARLLLVGDGPHRENLVRHIKKDKIGDKVIFTGYLGRDDVRSAYHASDALFFASSTETQGLVISEAMSAGLPVVAIQDLAIADAVTDGVNGFLCPEDPQALAAAIDKLLGDPALRSSMSAASLRRAEDLSIENQAERLADVYTGLLSTHPSPRRGGLRTGAVGKRVMRQIGSLRRRGSRLVRRYL